MHAIDSALYFSWYYALSSNREEPTNVEPDGYDARDLYLYLNSIKPVESADLIDDTPQIHEKM